MTPPLKKNGSIYVQVEPLKSIVTETFKHNGCSAEEASRIAVRLSGANLRGHDSHGVIRVPRYVDYLKEGKQIAGVMSMVRRARAMRKGEDFDEKQDKLLADAVEKLQDQGSLAVEATGLISDDGIIDPRDTRTVLGICLSVAGNKPIEGTEEYGVFRL